ncbi:hypothetical protein NN561_007307 [Cricetulus griseus]
MIAITSTYPKRKGIKKPGIPQAPCVLATFLEGTEWGDTRSSREARIGRGPPRPPGDALGEKAPPGPSNRWPFKSTTSAQGTKAPLRGPAAPAREPPPESAAATRLPRGSPARAARVQPGSRSTLQSTPLCFSATRS